MRLEYGFHPLVLLKDKHCLLNAGSRPSLTSTLALRVSHLEWGVGWGQWRREREEKTEEHKFAKNSHWEHFRGKAQILPNESQTPTGGGSMDLGSEYQNASPDCPSLFFQASMHFSMHVCSQKQEEKFTFFRLTMVQEQGREKIKP